MFKDNYTTNSGKSAIGDDRKILVNDFIECEMKGGQLVKVIKQGQKFADVIYLKKKTKPNIKKLSKEKYIELKTGEIKEFNLLEGKTNIRSLQLTFKRLIELIRCNFSNDKDSNRQKMITLTYVENMTNEKQLYTDFDKFMKRLKYKYSKYKFEYIAVAEPQERGAWHFHILLKADKNLFMKCDEIKELWGLGRTWTEALKGDDAGRYYAAYFTNLNLEDMSKEEKNKQGTEIYKQKSYVKGSRLKFYPKNFKFYRCSRGLKKPVVYFDTWDNVIKEYGEPNWQKSYQFYYMEDGKMEEVNLLHKASFKKQL